MKQGEPPNFERRNRNPDIILLIVRTRGFFPDDIRFIPMEEGQPSSNPIIERRYA